MRSFRRRDRGLSEIVGTLILILIVVSAATLLAAFVASYQKQLQSEQSYAHDQSLEDLRIVGLQVSINPAGTMIRNINFTLTSEYINPSGVRGIAINGIVLASYWVQNVVNRSWQHIVVGPNGTLVLGPEQQVFISTNTSATNNSYVLSVSGPPLPNQYLEFDVYTSLENDFRQTFLPPAPLAVVSEINPSGNNPLTLLDGSMSFQPEGNASIVDWAWTVSGGNLTSNSASVSGATYSSGTEGSLETGTVTATGATALFTVPTGFTFGVGDIAEFTPSFNLTVSGTGTCALSGSDITSATGLTSGNSLLVTFDFSTTITAGCTDATISIVAPGVMVVALPTQVTYVANGEEVEISPALPALGPDQPLYQVTLAVTNSDGLVGTMTAKYAPPV